MKNRQAGMDRLRILSAWFVVCIHLFALLGDLGSSTGISLFVNAFVYALVFCAVNCFGLLSGWLGYREEGNSLRLKPLVLLWLQFVFYRVFFLLLPSLLGIAEVSLADVFQVLSLADALCGETHIVGSGAYDADALLHAGLGVGGWRGCHALQAYGVGAAEGRFPYLYDG